MKTVIAYILVTFPCALDGIGVEKKLFKAGTVNDVPSHLVDKLVEAKYITLDIPEGKEQIVPEDIEEEEEVELEEYSKEWFLAQGTEKMQAFLKDYDEYHEDDATDDELAVLCAAVMADEEDED